MSPVLQASSPDEEALVQGAAYLGFKLISRTTDEVVIQVAGEPKPRVYDILAVLEFNSDRKRMSIITRSRHDGRVVLMCKGADSVMLARAIPGQAIVGPINEHLVGLLGGRGMVGRLGWSCCCYVSSKAYDGDLAAVESFSWQKRGVTCCIQLHRQCVFRAYGGGFQDRAICCAVWYWFLLWKIAIITACDVKHSHSNVWLVKSI